MTGRDEGDGFLRRWSRLKSDARPADAEPVEQNAVAPSEPETTEADEAALAELPDIDTLDKDSDYTVFLRDGVPEALRQRALRKLWLSDPVLANLDGLNDYDDDFAAIVQEGAAYMQRLVDAGERLTRPGAEDEPAEEAAAEMNGDAATENDSGPESAPSDDERPA